MFDVQSLVRSLPRRAVLLKHQVAIASACVFAATALRLVVDPVVNDGPFLTFFPALLAASVWGGTRAGSMTLGLSSLVAGYLWVDPDRTLALTKLGATTLMAFLIAGGMILLCTHLLHAAAAMARQSEERADLIAREMRHRIGNDLALVGAIMRLSARNATDVADLRQRFEARLRVLADAQAATRPDSDLPPRLRELLEGVLRPFDEEQISFSGPDLAIEQQDRPMLALVVHELATNAVKHGALSVPEGRVSLSWARAGRVVRLDWVEAGGPPVRAPSRTGFGTQLARAAFPPARGEVRIDYDPAGVRCAITLAAGDARRETAESSPGPLAASSRALEEA